jgi:hypothetical protein
VSLIAQEVQHTREHLNSSDFKHDLHAVLFRAWQQNIGMKIGVSTSLCKSCVRAKSLYFRHQVHIDLMQSFIIEMD